MLAKLACLLLFTTAVMATPEMDWPKDLDPATTDMLRKALLTFEKHPAIPYKTGASTVDEGMDCSGAITHILSFANITPPRSSAAMHEWLRKTTTFVVVPSTARTADHSIYRNLRPGDLIFWAPEGEDTAVSHVHMYLGKEKSDGRAVMIGSSDGRSYRGTKQSGYGIVDFKVPAPGSKTRIVGYGPVPQGKKP